MKPIRWGRAFALGLAVVFALLAGMPVADPPVRFYDGAAAMAEISAVLAVVFAWVSLAVSSRRRRDFIAAFGLNLLAVFFLCRVLNDLGACYSYYVAG